MAESANEPNEQTRLLSVPSLLGPQTLRDIEAGSQISNALSKEEEALGNTAVGEILPYNDYSSIDFLHDLVKDAYRRRTIHSGTGIRDQIWAKLDSLSGWICVTIIGIVTGFIAFFIDVAEASISDLKFGYCSENIFHRREVCCRLFEEQDLPCDVWMSWGSSYAAQFFPYLGIAALVGVISSSITMFSKVKLPAAMDSLDSKSNNSQTNGQNVVKSSKSIYMAAGAGVPEIKTILSGFVIPHFLGIKILLLKTFGAIFAVASGLPLGKEAPLIHIGACAANIVGHLFPKYAHNGKALREVITAGSAAGISAAFGAPIGGVLFAYEELSVYFPRKALYRTFLCSMAAAITLKFFNPTGTGKLVLFETHYGSSYTAVHYLVFVLIGVVGGIWGGTFTKANQLWAGWFRKYSIIKNHPIFEVFIVVVIVSSLQFVDPATRARYDVVIRNLLVDCQNASASSWVCKNEALENNTSYILWLIYGTVQVLLTTTITAGIKVPSGIIMPALAGGALFGRLIGQSFSDISPGIFAMVAAGAFLAGVTRMTISLCVVMFELTGELEYVIPHMVAILCAKWTADLISKESIYDLTQSALGHPFLSPDESIDRIASTQIADTAEVLIPPPATMQDLTVEVPENNKVPRSVLQEKLNSLKRRGLMDSGLVLVQGRGIIQGYLAQAELEFGLNELGKHLLAEVEVRLLGSPTEDSDLDLTKFVNRAPVCVCASAPVEVVVAIFTLLGVRYVCLTEEGTGKLAGVVIRKRLIGYLDSIKEKEH